MDSGQPASHIYNYRPHNNNVGMHVARKARTPLHTHTHACTHARTHACLCRS
jgi:hypothetical protein